LGLLLLKEDLFMKKLIQINVLFIVFFSIFACHQQKISVNSTSDKPEVLLSLKENSLNEFDDYLIINSQEELENVFVKINITRMPGIPAPTIDFENKSVLLINKKLDDKAKGDLILDKISIKKKVLSVNFKETDETVFQKIPNANRVIKMYLIDKVDAVKSIIFEP